MPQIVEVLKYVHEIYEEDNLGLVLSTDLAAVEIRYHELYGNAKKQLDLLLGELRALRTSHPNLRTTIELIEKFLLDFDKLASAQRIVPVDREKIVEKEITKGVLVPTNDLRGELALSLLVEKLVLELRRIKKQNSSIRFELDDEINLIFFSEFDGTSKLSPEFQDSLKRFTNQAIAKFTENGGKWTSDHELMLHTVLTERFAIANVIKQANEEVIKAKELTEIKAHALREKEGQLQLMAHTIDELKGALSQLRENSPSLGENTYLIRSFDVLRKLFTP